jgi:predicted secreted protein
MGIIGNGSNLLVFNATTGEVIACQKNVDVSFSDDIIDVTCKQDNGYTTLLPGKRTFNISCEALVDWQPSGTDEGISELVALYDSRSPIEFNLADPTNTDIYFNGIGYIESLEVNAGTETEVTYTATISGTGDLQTSI